MKNFAEEIKKRNEKTMEKEGTAVPPKDVKDYIKAVDQETGRVGEENAPTDKNIGGDEQQAPGTSSTPNAEQTEPEQNSMVLATVNENQGKKTSFLDPDLEKGLWDTLDKKVKEALSGNTPEDVAQNMAIAFLTFWCELVSNYADHIRHERKRLDKEYKEKTAEWDKNMGVTPLHKTLAIWATIADHPAMKDYANKPVTKETVQAAYNLYRSDMNVQKTALRVVSAMVGRELTKKEANTYFENAFKAKFGNATLRNIKGVALNDSKLMEGIQLAGAQKEILSTHQRVQGHRDAVAQNQADRSNLNAAQGQHQQTADYTRTNTSGRSI